MKTFNGEDAVKFLTGKNGLIDAKMRSLNIFENDGVTSVELFFSARNDADYDSLVLKFERIIDFRFAYSKEYIFGNVEDEKLFISDDGDYYFSIDPAQDSTGPCDNDADIVRAKFLTAIVK